MLTWLEIGKIAQGDVSPKLEEKIAADAEKDLANPDSPLSRFFRDSRESIQATLECETDTNLQGNSDNPGTSDEKDID